MTNNHTATCLFNGLLWDIHMTNTYMTALYDKQARDVLSC